MWETLINVAVVAGATALFVPYCWEHLANLHSGYIDFSEHVAVAKTIGLYSVVFAVTGPVWASVWLVAAVLFLGDWIEDVKGLWERRHPARRPVAMVPAEYRNSSLSSFDEVHS